VNSYSKKYFSNLDATRFLSCLTVFLHHTILKSNDGSSGSLYKYYDTNLSREFVIGLDYYVVLSGFLISWVILEEYKFTSKFNLGNYYVRRILRTWPLYFLLIVLGYGLIWFARQKGLMVHDMPPVQYLLTFTLNFYILKYGMAFLFFIAFLWSICVEEQFYALWGILLKWGRKYFSLLCVLLIAVSLVFRIMNRDVPGGLFFNSLNWASNFAIGGLMAEFCMKGGKWFEKLKQTPKVAIAAVYALFILNVIFYPKIYASPAMEVPERLIIALFFAFMIFEQGFCNKHLFELGKSKAMSYLGKIAYGLFCFHGPVTLLFEKVTERTGWMNNNITVFIINPLIIFAVTLGISAISYKYLEKPIMALRYKLKAA